MMTEEHCAVMRKTLEHIVAYPDGYDQSLWGCREVESSGTACSTSFCFAGHAAVSVAGATPIWDDNGTLDEVVVPLADVADPRVAKYLWSTPTRSGIAHVAEVSRYARHVLGLNVDQSINLFNATNSLRRVAELCYLYSDGRVDLLHALPAPIDRDHGLEDAAAGYDYDVAAFHERMEALRVGTSR